MKRLERSMWYLWVRTAAILVLASAAVGQSEAKSAKDDWKVIEDRWYVMEMAGAKAGWMNAITEQSDDQYRTTSKTELEIDRGGSTIKIAMETAFIETLDGKPVSVDSVSQMSRQTKRTRWKFTPENIIQTTTDGGEKSAKRLPLPGGEWLTPQAAERYASEQRASGTKEFSYRTLDPQNGVQAMSITSKRIGEDVHDANGTKTKVTLWSTTTDIVNITATEKYDAEGTMLYQELPMMGIQVITRLASKEEALREGGAAPEMLFNTVVKPDKPIENHMKATKATLQLKTKQGEMPELPTSGAQRFRRGEDGRSATLVVDINDNISASAEDDANRAYRDPSGLVDSDDPLVKKLAKRAEAREEKGGDQSDSMRRAEALRRLVHKHITRKGMQTAFASASETARTKEGDCSEHGVLLCALLRADGIPARVAMGLVYADAFAGAEGIFGWHMWTQALIDGKWVDFDATLPVRYNAAHVLTSTSSLADAQGITDMASAIQLIGNLEIEVVDVKYE
jgi:transglutaminase-like putative cysteine protease